MLETKLLKFQLIIQSIIKLLTMFLHPRLSLCFGYLPTVINSLLCLNWTCIFYIYLFVTYLGKLNNYP